MLLRLAQGATCSSQLPAPGGAAARDVIRDVPRRQSGPRLRRHLRLPGPGPYGDKPAYDYIIQAASGLAALQASIVGEPRYVPTIVADKSSSMTGAGRGARRALPQRAPAGAGSRGADVREHGGLGDGRASLRRDVRTARWTGSATSGSRPNRRPFGRGTATSRSFPTPIRTGGTSSSSPAGRTCSTIRASRRSGPGCARIEVAVRGAGEDRAHPHQRGVAGRAATGRNIPAMTVNTLEALLHDPHLEAVGFWQIVEHPTEGTMRLPGLPATYGKTPGAIRRLPHPAWESTAWRSCARSGSARPRSRRLAHRRRYPRGPAEHPGPFGGGAALNPFRSSLSTPVSAKPQCPGAGDAESGCGPS